MFKSAASDSEACQEPKIAVIDSLFPQAVPLGFRNYEINGILDALPASAAYAMYPMRPGREAWFAHGYGKDQKQYEKDFASYLSVYPHNQNRIHYLKDDLDADLVYCYFLAETYTLLPYLEENNLPFVFILYPGGAFGLNNDSSDRMLRRIFVSPCFRKVIVTQKVTREYLAEKGLCPAEKIDFLFCGYTQFALDEIPQKHFYKRDKDTFDICFVAHKYSECGVDKGYDLFIEAAKHFASKYPDMRFHVIGNFDETDIDISAIKDKITFYGLRKPDYLKSFYPNMDICLSPNRPYKLYEGNFDGFPLGFDAMSFETVLLTTDELHNNDGFFRDDEVVVIKPEIQDIISKIEPLYLNTERLYQIGRQGQKRLYELMAPEERLQSVINILTEECTKISQEKNMENKDSEVEISVVVTTYKHDKYIAECLDSILKQKDCPNFEIVIGNDCSPDQTADILNDYAKKHPDKIRILPREKNLGMLHNLKDCLQQARGKYVAICEGDDYWCSEHKLVKQYNALRSAPKATMVYSKIKFLTDGAFREFDSGFNKDILTFSEMVEKQNPIGTFSCCMYKKSALAKVPEVYYEGDVDADFLFNLYVLEGDHAVCINDYDCVYRQTPGSLFSSLEQAKKLRLLVEMLVRYNKIFDYKYEKEFHGFMARVMACSYPSAVVAPPAETGVKKKRIMTIKLPIAPRRKLELSLNTIKKRKR